MFKYFKKTALATGLMVGAFALSAQGASFTIDPDDFAPGSSMCETGSETGCFGAMMSSNVDDLKVYSNNGVAIAGDTDGNQVFETQNFVAWGNIGSETFRVDFTTGNVISVSLDAIGTSSGVNGALGAYDASDNLLGFYATGSLPFREFETMTIASGTPIAYILAGSNGSPFIALDILSFETAEAADSPEALSLLALGLMGMGYGMYRRKKA